MKILETNDVGGPQESFPIYNTYGSEKSSNLENIGYRKQILHWEMTKNKIQAV